ncbi:response regulator [Ohtaekwangia koreensis]|uniref:Two component transcriptional regulator, LytTR family n=1 Tax=Ohtaekwangia koreensis TaxID=688867 RepID=A0A1T5MDA2_9BACT|nr:response regulator [Ohtaekwangia koreensis]SKC85964.1 two component transcriptional regulator, LytTR family [Ohtaekwangia koreensis]
MEKIKVLIVEDQLLIAEDIASRLEKHDLEIAGTCSSGEEAIASIEYIFPDLILMDINLSGTLDGIATAKAIQDKHDIPIIYLSELVDSKTVDRAKKTLPAAYLSKPFHEADLIRAIDLAFHNARARKQAIPSALNNFVFLRTDNQSYLKLAMEDILYLEADRAYCSLVCVKGVKYTLASSMSHVLNQLNSRDFMKVHRSFTVNINKITAFDGNLIKLGTLEVQMSKEFKNELMSRLKFIK